MLIVPVRFEMWKVSSVVKWGNYGSSSHSYVSQSRLYIEDNSYK